MCDYELMEALLQIHDKYEVMNEHLDQLQVDMEKFENKLSCILRTISDDGYPRNRIISPQVSFASIVRGQVGGLSCSPPAASPSPSLSEFMRSRYEEVGNSDGEGTEPAFTEEDSPGLRAIRGGDPENVLDTTILSAGLGGPQSSASFTCGVREQIREKN